MDNETLVTRNGKEDHLYMNAKYTFELNEKQDDLNICDAAETSATKKTPNESNLVVGDRTSTTPTNYHVNQLYDM